MTTKFILQALSNDSKENLIKQIITSQQVIIIIVNALKNIWKFLNQLRLHFVLP